MLRSVERIFCLYLPSSAYAVYSLLYSHLRDLFSCEQIQPILLEQYASHILYYLKQEYNFQEIEVLNVSLALYCEPGSLPSVKATYEPVNP